LSILKSIIIQDVILLCLNVALHFLKLANLREDFAIELSQYKDTTVRDHEIAVRLNELQEQHRSFVDKCESTF